MFKDKLKAIISKGEGENQGNNKKKIENKKRKQLLSLQQ